MNLKKCLVSTLAAAMLLGVTTAGAYQNESYGGRSFRTVTVPLNGAATGSIVTADNSVTSDQPAAAIIGAAGGNVTAAINGMFFNSYYKAGQGITFPGNCPLILTNLALNGQGIACGGKSNAVGFTKDGKVVIDVVDMQPHAYVDANTDPVRFSSINNYAAGEYGVFLITEHMKLPFTPAPGSSCFVIQNGMVTQQIYSTYTVQPGQMLLVFNSASAQEHAGWSMLPHVGSTVRITTDFTANRGADWSDMTSMAGGGRMLVYNGQVVSADAGFNASLDGDPKQRADFVAQRSFIAVMADGTALLGTGTGSFNEIAQFLKGRGAVDALSLDGGASSMLYENGTYVTPAGRELASVIVFRSLVAQPRARKIIIDGTEVTFDAYNINNANYIKLRDFASAMTQYGGAGKVFNVVWNNAYRAVEMTSGTQYVPVGGELAPGQNQSPVTPLVSKDPVYKDSSLIPMNAYKIGGSNYLKLRDICRAFDIGVDWDGGRQAVVVTSANSYTE